MKREDALLAELNRKYQHNQAIANNILTTLKKKNVRLGIAVSSEGLTFFDRCEATPDGVIFTAPKQPASAELAKMGFSQFLALDESRTV